MTLLKRATIKSYDAGTHRAAVGISGSLSVWLDSIAVSDSIPAAALVVGRECAVLFHDDVNPDDAVVISVHGGGPPSASADQLIDADGDTKVQVEEAADEDKVRMDVAGTERLVLQDSSPHLLITGEQRVTEKLVIGDPAPPLADSLEIFLPSIGTVTAGYTAFSMHTQGITLGTNDNQGVAGLDATPYVLAAAGTSGHLARGLNFFGVVSGSGNFTEVSAIWAKPGALLYSGTIDKLTTFRAATPTVLFGSPTVNEARALWIETYGHSSITDIYGIDIGALVAGTNRRGIYVADITGGTIARTLELQNAMYVEGTGNWTPAANETPVWIYEGTTPTARQVKWKAGNTLGAGDKVMVLV